MRGERAWVSGGNHGRQYPLVCLATLGRGGHAMGGVASQRGDPSEAGKRRRDKRSTRSWSGMAEAVNMPHGQV